MSARELLAEALDDIDRALDEIESEHLSMALRDAREAVHRARLAEDAAHSVPESLGS